MLNLKDRLSELDILLDNIDSYDRQKIPNDIIIGIKENKNKDYNWEYDQSISFEDQEINNDTLILFLLIMYKYIANEEEKKEIDTILNDNLIEYNKKYSFDNIFKKNNSNSQNEITNETEQNNKEKLLIEYKESLFIKIKKFIKNLFKLKEKN